MLRRPLPLLIALASGCWLAAGVEGASSSEPLECPADRARPGVTRRALVPTLLEGIEAAENLRGAEVMVAWARVERDLPCLVEVLERQDAARVFELSALAEAAPMPLPADGRERSVRAFQVLLSLDPAYELPRDLREHARFIDILDAARAPLDPVPDTARVPLGLEVTGLMVDGRRSVGHPALAQRVRRDWTTPVVVCTSFVRPGAALECAPQPNSINTKQLHIKANATPSPHD